MEEQIRKKIDVVVDSFGLEIYDVEIFKSQKMIRLYIDSPKGVTIAQCTKIAGLLTPAVNHYSYHLEVSSPGVERKLRNLSDYENALGKIIKIKTKRAFRMGRLVRVDNEGFDLKTNDEINNYSYNSVKKANLVVSNKELFGGKGARSN